MWQEIAVKRSEQKDEIFRSLKAGNRKEGKQGDCEKSQEDWNEGDEERQVRERTGKMRVESRKNWR